MPRRQRHSSSMSSVEQPGAQAIVDVVGVVGDVVGDRRALRFEAGEAVELEVVQLAIVERSAAAPAPLRPRAVGVDQRAVVLDQPLQRLPGQVQPVELRIAPLELR